MASRLGNDLKVDAGCLGSGGDQWEGEREKRRQWGEDDLHALYTCRRMLQEDLFL